MRIVAGWVLWLAVAMTPVAALAQDAGSQSAAESRSASFQAVEGSEREEISGGALLLSAYGAIMTLLVGYVGWIAMLQQRTQRDVARLKAQVDRAAAKSGS